MPAVESLGFGRCGNRPHTAHLAIRLLDRVLRRVPSFHRRVVERVARGRGFSGPDQRLVTCGETAAGKILAGSGFEPAYCVQDSKSQHAEGVTARIDAVVGAANPERAFWPEHAAAGGDP